jgi:hypothetical protein
MRYFLAALGVALGIAVMWYADYDDSPGGVVLGILLTVGASAYGVRSSRVLMGLAWAAAWAPLGALLSVIWDPAAARDGIFVPVGAPPGLLCGVLFFAVLAIAEARRRLDEVPLYRAGAWGTMVGLFVGALPLGISQPTTDLPMELLAAETIGPVAVLSAASAVASVLSARMVRDLHGGSASAA